MLQAFSCSPREGFLITFTEIYEPVPLGSLLISLTLWEALGLGSFWVQPARCVSDSWKNLKRMIYVYKYVLR